MKDVLNNIKALVFDAYGTLLDVKSLDSKLSDHFGEKAIEINNLWRQKQLQYTWLRSLMEQYQPFSIVTQEALRFACKSLKVKLSQEVLTELMNQYYMLDSFPEVPGLLNTLSNHYQCAILSNADMPMLKEACQHNRIKDSLHAILSVDQVKVNKPSPAVYQLAIDQFGCNPEEVAFVSSNTWDVAGAKAFGFKVIWLNRLGGTMEMLGFEPNWEINNLNQINPL